MRNGAAEGLLMQHFSYHSLFSAASDAEDRSAALRELVFAGASPIDEILLKERMLPVSLATAPIECER